MFESEDNAASAATVLLVDSEEINRRLLKAIFKTTPYTILEARKASEAMALLQSEKIDLVILDLMLPEMSGPELCRWMKARRSTQLIPVLMITSIQGVENEIVGISSGADEFLIKPLHPSVVRTRVRAMLRNKTLIDSLEEAETILLALAQAVEHRDRYTGLHCQRLAVASVMLGEALGLPGPDLTALYRGGYLHDIGKIGIPDAMLLKNGPLTAQEWEIMRSHPVRGEDICRPMKSLAPVLPIIRSHHEKLGRHGLSGRSGRRGHPAAGAHPASGRHLRCAHHRTLVQGGAHAAGGTRGDGRRSRRGAGAIRNWSRCSPASLRTSRTPI